MNPLKKLTDNYLFLALLAGVLLWLSWPPFQTAPLLFISFFPLFLLQDKIQEEGRKRSVFWIYAYIAMVLWNILTTWWLWYASKAGLFLAVFLNSAMMTLPWLAFDLTRKRYGNKLGYPAFVVFWLAFEYWHLNWQVSWPWLTLGNAFSTFTNWVQWYEYTGFLGGSLWVLIINILVFKITVDYNRTRVFYLAGLVIVPIVASYLILNKIPGDNSGQPVTVSIIQPNIDPYTDKFGGMTPQEQVDSMIALAERSMTPGTKLVVFPETAVLGDTYGMDEGTLEDYPAIRQLRDFCRRHKVTILTGADTYYFYKQDEKRSATARQYQNQDLYYDSYNTALLVDSNTALQVYHKSKLVPGVEILPYPQIFRPIEKIFDLGGTSGTLGIQDDAEVFTTSDSLKLAPIICYESIYGDWVGSYVRQGANLLCIITNDGWWRNTPGYRQHLLYAKLRAIETRRSIVRSGNTGISAFINHKGEIEERTGWWVPAYLNNTTHLKTEMTWYAQNGDYIGKLAAWLAAFVLLSAIVKSIVRKGY